MRGILTSRAEAGILPAENAHFAVSSDDERETLGKLISWELANEDTTVPVLRLSDTPTLLGWHSVTVPSTFHDTKLLDYTTLVSKPSECGSTARYPLANAAARLTAAKDAIAFTPICVP